ncbi:phage tail fiber protein [Vibrio maritimus]|uniref:Phage tail fiber protein n=1 Tax=Vibrio maritimus TaxID=990268 RepID=A0A090S5E6_9VIBR|nr:phage tail fiber protein [Vibrio maritimus]
MEYIDLIGVPFEYNAREPKRALDCYGLVRELHRRQGIELPDYFTPNEEAETIASLMAKGKVLWKPVEPKEGAVMLIRLGLHHWHVATYLGDDVFIHTSEKTGGVCTERFIFGQIELRDSTSMLEQHNVKFVVIKNPMLPDDRLYLERQHVEGQSLHGYIGDLEGSYAISVNGKNVLQDALNDEFVNRGDVVVICPILHGGNGGKAIMRLVAVVALTVFTYGQAGWALGGLTNLTAGSTGLMALQAGVMIGGTLLINNLLPPTIDTAAAGDSAANDYTYGIDGAKNSSKDNIPVPLIYGRHRIAGNIIGNYTELQGQTQYLNMLINMGEGVAAGFDESSIYVNDQPIDSLSDRPEVTMYHGVDGQDVPKGFNRQITPIAVTNNSELTDPSSWTTITTSTGVLVDAVQANFNSSIVRIDDEGNEVSHSVGVELQMRKVGETEWKPMTTMIRAEDAAKGHVFDIIGDERFDQPARPLREYHEAYSALILATQTAL